jgi:hypothetical protein
MPKEGSQGLPGNPWLDPDSPYSGAASEYAGESGVDPPPLAPFQSFEIPNTDPPIYPDDDKCLEALLYQDYVVRYAGWIGQRIRDKNVDCLRLREWIRYLESGGGGPADDQRLIASLIDEWTSTKSSSRRDYILSLLRQFQSSGGQSGGGAIAIARARLERCEREYENLVSELESMAEDLQEASDQAAEACK